MTNISIIGGGIGGLALANCLQHFQIPFQLFEAAPVLGEVGAGIGISESTVEILGYLGLKEKLLQKGRFVRDAIIADQLGNTIRKLPVQNGGFCIHRMDLIDILKGNIPSEKILLNHSLQAFEQKESGVELHFGNGASLQTGFLIAADGINSLIRKKLWPAIEKRYSGQTIWRGIADISLPEKFQNAYLEFWGSNLRFATIPLNGKQYYWYAVQVAEEGGKDNPDGIHEFLQGLFKNHIPEVKQVISCTGKIIRNDMFDLKPHSFPWFSNNVVFLGDAIHATTPNLAQGGCQAMEDAFYLAALIKSQGVNENTFHAYQKGRSEKVNYIVKQSWRFGKMAHSDNAFSEKMVQLLFRILPGFYFRNQYEKLIDIEYLKIPKGIQKK